MPHRNRIPCPAGDTLYGRRRVRLAAQNTRRIPFYPACAPSCIGVRALSFPETIYFSMTDWDGAQPQSRTSSGWATTARCCSDRLMWLSLWHNLIWITVGTVTPVGIGLGLAVLVWAGMRGRLFFRTLYFMPVVLSSVVVGMIWAWIYHPMFGPINVVLRAIGLDSVARGWLGDLTWAIYALLLAGLWAYFGFCFVILLAALQNVDLELHDAAKIDGANAWQRFHPRHHPAA